MSTLLPLSGHIKKCTSEAVLRPTDTDERMSSASSQPSQWQQCSACCVCTGVHEDGQAHDWLFHNQKVCMCVWMYVRIIRVHSCQVAGDVCVFRRQSSVEVEVTLLIGSQRSVPLGPAPHLTHPCPCLVGRPRWGSPLHPRSTHTPEHTDTHRGNNYSCYNGQCRV